MKKDWNVIERKVGKFSNRQYIFGNISDEFSEDELKDIEVIPYEEWEVEDFKEILEASLEDANYHEFTKLPSIIDEAIDSVCTWSCKEELMKIICNKIYHMF